jgi:hypothetical protein
MKVNGESIRGTARTPLPVQAWGESTRKGSTLFLHVLAWPGNGRLVVGGLLSPVRRAYLLSDPQRAPLPVGRAGPRDLVLRVPARAPDDADTVIALDIGGEVAVDPARLLSVDVGADTLRAFDGRLRGTGLSFGAGKPRDAYVQGWSRAGDSVGWPVRLNEAAAFDVAVSYDAPPPSAGGAFRVRLGGRSLPGVVQETPGRPVGLGRVRLEPGAFEIAVEAVDIRGDELMRLRSVVLTPVPAGGSDP